ncbi:MAG: cupin domain-containing protein [Actinomycetota bacterium]
MTPNETLRVVPWDRAEPQTTAGIESIFRDEGLFPSRWSNGPGDRYGEHAHSYHKVLYCARGSITFVVEGQDVPMRPGDRLELPPETRHSAIVGPEGVVCYEGHR